MLYPTELRARALFSKQARPARIIHECRSEAAETEVRPGFSQARTTQAYSQQYVEEAEREEPRRTRGSDAAVGIPWITRAGMVGARGFEPPTASSRRAPGSPRAAACLSAADSGPPPAGNPRHSRGQSTARPLLSRRSPPPGRLSAGSS